MEFRQPGYSGLKVPVLSFGCGTFGDRGLLAGWGNTAVARRLVDICLDSGVDRFAIADLYFQVASEEILGKAIAGRRNTVLFSTKATFPMGNAPSSGGRVRIRREAPLECRS